MVTTTAWIEDASVVMTLTFEVAGQQRPPSRPKAIGMHRNKRQRRYSRVAAEFTPDEPVLVVMTRTVDVGAPTTPPC